MKSIKNTICIVIPTFNRKELLKTLIRQIYSQMIEDYNIKIIVVIDGSIDGTYEMLEKEFPDIHIVMGDGSWWYTKSMNEGFKFAEKLNPDYVLALNDDVEINRDYINNIISAYHSVENGSIIGSLCLSKSRPLLVVSSGNILKNKVFGIYKHYLPFLSKQHPKNLSGIKKTEILPGRGLLIPFSTLKALNYFDEKFVQYHSDGDFCLRAKKKDYSVYISWDALIFCHINMTSSNSSFKKQKANHFLLSFFNKYSRNYLPAKALFTWRHYTKVWMPFKLFLDILLIIKYFFLPKKIN